MFIKSLKNYIKVSIEDLDKKVEFVHDRFDASQIPYRHRLFMKDVLVQFIRDAIYHRIESPRERDLLEKTEHGNIEISTFINDNSYIVKFRDDGKGIETKKLGERAALSEKWKGIDVNLWDRNKYIEVMFDLGFSAEKNKDIMKNETVY